MEEHKKIKGEKEREFFCAGALPGTGRRMKLHNKFEIKTKTGKTIIAKNRIFDRVFSELASYGGYTTYVSIGNGIVDTQAGVLGSLQNECMTASLAILKTEVVEYQLDPTKGALSATHKIVLPAGLFEEKYITEIGFCVLPEGVQETSENGVLSKLNHCPELFNYAYFADANGTPQSVRVESGSLEILATIYLDWDNSNGIMPLGGDNKFLKFLLGENVFGGVAPEYHFGIGQDHRPNDVQVECDYIPSLRYQTAGVVPQITRTAGGIEFLFAGSNTENATVIEVALVANGKTVVRQNRETMPSTATFTETLVVSNMGNLCIKNAYPGELISITNTSTGEVIDDSEQLKALPKTTYGCTFSEAYPMPFGEDKDYNVSDTGDWRVFESKCGNMLAFVSSDTVDIYIHKNDRFEKLDSAAILDPQTIVDVEFFFDHVFVVRAGSPFVNHYVWQAGTLQKMEFDFCGAIAGACGGAVFDGSSGQTLSFGIDSEGDTTCAVVFGADIAPYVLRFKTQQNQTILDNSHQMPLVSTNFAVAMLAHGEVEGCVLAGGVDDTGLNVLYTYANSEGDQLVSSSQMSTEFNTNVVRIQAGLNHVYVNRSSNPYNLAIFFPSRRRFFLFNEPDVVAYVGKNGVLGSRYNLTNNKFQGMYMKGDSVITAMGNMPAEEMYVDGVLVGAKHAGNGMVLFRNTAPHTVYYNFGSAGYTVIHGFKTGNACKVVGNLLSPTGDKSKKNIVMSLCVYI